MIISYTCVYMYIYMYIYIYMACSFLFWGLAVRSNNSGNQDACWSLLKLVEACWSLLKRVEACWSLLRLVEACWSLLNIVEHCWTLLMPPRPPHSSSPLPHVVIYIKRVCLQRPPGKQHWVLGKWIFSVFAAILVPPSLVFRGCDLHLVLTVTATKNNTSYIYIYIYIYVCVYIYMYIHIHTYMHTYIPIIYILYLAFTIWI